MAVRIHHDDERVPELEELHLPARSDGPAAAAVLAAGVGVLLLGLATMLNEASAGIHDFLASLDFGQGVGPLAGKTIVAVVGWLMAWLILGYAWRGRDVDIRRAFLVGLAFGGAGVVLTFPPVFLAVS